MKLSNPMQEALRELYRLGGQAALFPGKGRTAEALEKRGLIAWTAQPGATDQRVYLTEAGYALASGDLATAEDRATADAAPEVTPVPLITNHEASSHSRRSAECRICGNRVVDHAEVNISESMSVAMWTGNVYGATPDPVRVARVAQRRADLDRVKMAPAEVTPEPEAEPGRPLCSACGTRYVRRGDDRGKCTVCLLDEKAASQGHRHEPDYTRVVGMGFGREDATCRGCGEKITRPIAEGVAPIDNAEEWTVVPMLIPTAQVTREAADLAEGAMIFEAFNTGGLDDFTCSVACMRTYMDQEVSDWYQDTFWRENVRRVARVPLIMENGKRITWFDHCAVCRKPLPREGAPLSADDVAMLPTGAEAVEAVRGTFRAPGGKRKGTRAETRRSGGKRVRR